jgi:general secretion pathway protein A
VLELMRLLTNLETNQRKLLQIILLGQSELAEMLARPELRQLAQRVVARYHLGPLAKQEVADYVRHRLGVAGTQRKLFPDSLMSRLYKLSGGTPRVINVLCDRALLGAYVQAKERVDSATLKQAAREVFHQPAKRPRSVLLFLIAGLLASTALAVLQYKPDVQSPVPTKTEAKTEVKTEVKAEPAKPETPVAVTPVTLEWPAAKPRSQSKAMAYTALFRAWGADYREGDECLQASDIGLSCRSARGGLDELRQLNRPAVLLLSDKQGQKFYAMLSLLDDKVAIFNVANQTIAVAIDALAEQWSGQYTLLWRSPPVAQSKIKLGDHGPNVEWLRNQLAQIDGKPVAAAEDPVFDETMLRQVKQFQLARGLPPTGIVSTQTMIRLSSAADMTAPKLVHEQGGK